MTASMGKKGDSVEVLVGLLAFQGAFSAHGRMLQALGVPVAEVRTRDDLSRCTHLVLPGGESTAFLKLLEYHDLTDALKDHAKAGKPILATCAGLILLAREAENPRQKSLGLIDVRIERNGYGRQIDSFEADLNIPILGSKPFHGVFIRSPIIRSTGNEVETLATFEGNPVFVREGNIFGTTFHPELSEDTRLHELFFFGLIAK